MPGWEAANTIAIVAALIAAIAVVISIVSVKWARKSATANETAEQARHTKTVADIETARRADELAERAQRAEAAKDADVRLRVDLRGQEVTVENHGPADASNVTVSERSGTILLGGERTVTRLAARDAFTLMASFVMSAPYPLTFDVVWTDGRGERRIAFEYSPT